MNIRNQILSDSTIANVYHTLAKENLDDFSLAQKCLEIDSENIIPGFISRFIVDTFSEEIKKGNADAMNDLGVYYMFGRGGVIQEKKAFHFFSLGAKKHHIQAMENLGFCFRVGFGTEPDAKKAFDCFIRGALLDSIPSLYNIAELYEEKDSEFSFLLYQKCWKLSDEETLNFLGYDLCMKLGKAYLAHKNGNDALFFFEKASDYSDEYPNDWISKAQKMIGD